MENLKIATEPKSYNRILRYKRNAVSGKMVLREL